MTAARIIVMGGLELPLDLGFSTRRTLGISVTPDLRLVVQAPAGTEPAAVEAKVKRKADWVIRQVRYFEQFQPIPIPREYVSGESHLYLGRQYRLKVRRGPAEVKLLAGCFWVTLRPPFSGRLVERLLYSWYRARAEAVFARRLRRVLSEMPELRNGELTYSVRRMRTRWGSCSPDGRLTLNIELIKAPLSCVDYVLVHELAHLLVFGHGPRFWELVAAHRPDHATWRRWLRAHSHELHAALDHAGDGHAGAPAKEA